MKPDSKNTNSLILGLDIGTQAVKGVVVRLDGQVVAQAGLERGPSHPRPGWVEMDAERDWWGASLQVVRDLLKKLDVSPEKIAAIGISGLVPCLCPLDADGIPLRPAILYSDNRALDELDWVNKQGSLSLWAEAVVPKLVWLQRHEPEVIAKTQVILSGHSYMVFRLTGEYSMDYDTAGIMGGIFDPVSKSWRSNLCDQLGLPVEVLPPLKAATDVVGCVTVEAAQATGLVEGTPVIAGSGDTFPTIVGCGAIETGDAMVSFGTTGLLTIANRPLEESSAGPHFSSPEKGASVTWGANVLSAGRLVRWFRDQFSGAERTVSARMGQDEFVLLEAQASRIPPGAEGLIILPHWLGRRTPTPSATLRGAMLGLNPSHTTAHIYRALLESFAFNIRQGYEVHREQVTRLVVTAGGARSPLWRQIMADILNTELEYHPSASGSLGIAFQAAYALGLVDEYTDIKNRWLSDALRIKPDPAAVQVYDRLFPVYCAFDEVVAEPFRLLSEALRGDAV
jgi:xylulokinase